MTEEKAKYRNPRWIDKENRSLFCEILVGQSYRPCQINVGNMFYFGEGVGKNYPKAHMWWSFAKEKGVAAAFSNLTMIENKMTNSQLLEAQKLYNICNSNYP